MNRNKIVITCLNGIGSYGDVINEHYDVRDPHKSEGTDRYLSHTLIRERDRLLALEKDPPSIVPIYGKGGIGTEEKRILSQVMDILEPEDCWLAVGYSYGAYDTHKMIKAFWKAHGGLKAPCPWIGFVSIDLDWAASAILRPFQRLGLTTAPCHFGYNVYQRGSWPGGVNVRHALIPNDTYNPDPDFQPRSFSIEVPHPNHHGMDTSTFARGAIGFTLRAALAEVRHRQAL